MSKKSTGTRIIDGHIYTDVRNHVGKGFAKKYAKKIRKQGKKARVMKHEGEYSVFVRK